MSTNDPELAKERAQVCKDCPKAMQSVCALWAMPGDAQRDWLARPETVCPAYRWAK